MADLQGRIALVTGAAQGIGRAIAMELAAAGATLALADMNEARLNETTAELASTGAAAAAFVMNVSSQESIETGAGAILDKFGKVEILINNAGITRDNLMLRMKRADWDSVISINLGNSNTWTAGQTFSGSLTFSGLSTGTQVSCLGLTSGNAVALSTGACGSGGGSTPAYVTAASVGSAMAAGAGL